MRETRYATHLTIPETYGDFPFTTLPTPIFRHPGGLLEYSVNPHNLAIRIYKDQKL
jgi:hypothetical protein